MYCDGTLLDVHLGVFGSIWKVREERDEQRQTSIPTVIVKYVNYLNP